MKGVRVLGTCEVVLRERIVFQAVAAPLCCETQREKISEATVGSLESSSPLWSNAKPIQSSASDTAGCTCRFSRCLPPTLIWNDTLYLPSCWDCTVLRSNVFDFVSLRSVWTEDHFCVVSLNVFSNLCCCAKECGQLKDCTVLTYRKLSVEALVLKVDRF